MTHDLMHITSGSVIALLVLLSTAYKTEHDQERTTLAIMRYVCLVWSGCLFVVAFVGSLP